MVKGRLAHEDGRSEQRPTDLLERERALEQIDSMLERASTGVGCALLIEGPAGIGKTELLARTRTLAAERGMETLVARGGELERDLPFVIARELLAPRVSRAREAERRELMAGAASLAVPVIGADARGGESSTSGDELFATYSGGAALSAVLHGLFWLCSNLADRRPLLLAVDDVHWADPASLRFLSYLAHRVADLPVLLALARRTGEPEAGEAVIDAIRAEPACSALELSPLSPEAVAKMLDASYEGRVAEKFARACHGTTGGNPFLVRELLVTLHQQGLGPQAEHAERVEAVRPARIADAVRTRLGRQPAAAIELARAVAVLGTRVELRHAAKLLGIGEAVCEEAADALAAADLIESRRPLTFRHPIIRSAIYGELPAGRRATDHTRAARMLAAEDAPAENIAGHLLHTEAAGDDEVVRILREAAATSFERGAPQECAHYLRRALAEPPSREHRSHALRELGAAEVAAGEPGAAEHLLEALTLSPLTVHAEIAEALSVALIAAARHEDAIAMLRDEIPGVAEVDQDAALRLEGVMLGAALLSGAAYSAPDELIPRLVHLRGETPGERVLLANGAFYLTLTDRSADEAVELASRAFAGDHLLTEARVDAPPFWLAVGVLVFAELYEEHRARVDEAQQEAARLGSVLGLALVLAHRAMGAYQRGLIADAVEDGRQSLRITTTAGWLGGLPFVLGIFVLALVERSELAAAERVLGDHGMATDLSADQLFDDIVLIARGTLRLAQGRPAEALDDLNEVARRQERQGVRLALAVWAWRPAAARALAALGDHDAARRTAKEQLQIARRWGTAGAIAAALRSMAAAEEGEGRVGILEEALSTLDGSDEHLQRMHTQLELGAALRRQRRGSESRGPLLEALDLAERAGAGLVAERARAELAATGIKRRKRTFLAGLEALTPSERRVAELAAEGLGNVEIAQRLFVTRKTVEKHLSNAYGKLEIAGREELPEALTKE